MIEELGTYDPHVADTDARTTINGERLKYWLGVGAMPSEKVAILIKKYGPEGIRSAEPQAARERLAAPKAVPDPGPPTFVLKPKKEKAEAAPAAEAPAAEAPPAEAAAPKRIGAGRAASGCVVSLLVSAVRRGGAKGSGVFFEPPLTVLNGTSR